MREDISISYAVAEMDDGIQRMLDRHGIPASENLRFSMHVNNIRLVSIEAIVSDRTEDVMEYLRGLSREELGELRDYVREDACDEKADKKWTDAAGQLESALDGMLNLL